MALTCLFCAADNPAGVLVCGNCSRDIAVPGSLIEERDELVRRRNSMKEQLADAKRELENLRRRRQRRAS